MNSLILMRRYFTELVHKSMKKDDRIWILVNDLGYKLWDQVRIDYSDRFINVGSSEQAMMGMAVGLALSSKIPIVYSITPFLLYRPFETIRNYINNEKIPVKLIGSGRDKEYSKEGFSHWAEEDKKIMKIFHNIQSYWPEENSDLPGLVSKMLKSNKPFYLNLKR